MDFKLHIFFFSVTFLVSSSNYFQFQSKRESFQDSIIRNIIVHIHIYILFIDISNYTDQHLESRDIHPQRILINKNHPI